MRALALVCLGTMLAAPGEAGPAPAGVCSGRGGPSLA
jgi:hypothetical protein